jgi:hypothetical protein
MTLERGIELPCAETEGRAECRVFELVSVLLYMDGDVRPVKREHVTRERTSICVEA